MSQREPATPDSIDHLLGELRTNRPLDIADAREAARRSPCRRCGSIVVTEVKIKRSPNYAGKAVCGGCSKLRLHMTKPRDTSLAPPPELLNRVKEIKRPVARIRGESDELVARAAVIRMRLAAAARRHRDLERAMVLMAITDASWFLAHERVARYDRITWPTVDQLVPPDVPAASVAVEGPQGDLCNLLQRLEEVGERPTETSWFAILDELQPDQGGADTPRQLALEAAPMLSFNGSD